MKSTLNLENKSLNIWSKLDFLKSEDKYEFEPRIGVILSQESNKVLWTNQISTFYKKNNIENSMLLKNKLLDTNQNPDKNLTYQVSLSSKSAQKLLNKWTPIQLLKTVSNNSSQPYIKDLILGVGTQEENEKSLLNIHAMLSLN